MQVNKDTKFLITGGAGFIGSNIANALLSKGYRVTVFDNLSRKGTEKNEEWLRLNHGNKFNFIQGDIRNVVSVSSAVSDSDVIFHLAAQVAVTTSVQDPRTDFEINALGTFNVLEAARNSGRNPFMLLTSTNKVYGTLDNIDVIEDKSRYCFKSLSNGVDESQPLDFHSPYGCSKGTADQYFRDYARIYNLKTVVFRMSCIYGPRQFGNEDQGWLAHFIISSILGRSITLYGNGKQVRDILYVDDLINAMLSALSESKSVVGQVYNIGGGPTNTISVWLEMKDKLKALTGRDLPLPKIEEWRPGDQPIYISDISKAKNDFGWKPLIDVDHGIKKLYDWISSNKSLF